LTAHIAVNAPRDLRPAGALLRYPAAVPFADLGDRRPDEHRACDLHIALGAAAEGEQDGGDGGTGGGEAYPGRMTGKADFTEEEWARLKRGPFVAGMAISLADPGGPIELVKETAATLKTVRAAAEPGGQGDLVDAVAKEVVAETAQRQNPLQDFKPRGALAAQEILDELTTVNRIVSEKATQEEADAYRAWLNAAAHEAADAAKEGGFLGFRAERVSEGEQRMLDRLAEVLGPAA
jgi:hypothetical protein